MLEKLKWYLVQVGVKKYLPVAVTAGMASLGTYLAAKSEMLASFGITYGVWPLAFLSGKEPQGPCLLIQMDLLGAATGAAIIAAIAVFARATQHHTTGTSVVPGGNRAGDPPANPTPVEGEKK